MRKRCSEYFTIEEFKRLKIIAQDRLLSSIDNKFSQNNRFMTHSQTVGMTILHLFRIDTSKWSMMINDDINTYTFLSNKSSLTERSEFIS